jgi:tetratricopeptide (TPR) repeat protein
MKLPILIALAGVAAVFCFRSPDAACDYTDAAGRMARQSEHAMVLFERGHLAEAKTAFRVARVECAQLLGSRDPATLSCRCNYAAVLYAMRDYAGAEAAQRTALALREDVLGRLAPDALDSLHNLAVMLLSEGKLEEALRDARRVEAGRRRMFGTNHPKSQEAARLKEFIEGAVEKRDRRNETPHGGPSGLGESTVGVS